MYSDAGAARNEMRAGHFTSTSMRIQGCMQHWKRCVPFESPVTSRWLPWTIRVLATATLEKPPVHSGTVASPWLRSSTNPPPKWATSVKVWGSPPWFATERMVSFRTVASSGSKSQPGSGVPAAALLNRSCSVVAKPRAPSATLWQKPVPPSPSAALKVVGSHSSSATTCTKLGPLCAMARVVPTKIAHPASRVSAVTLSIAASSCGRRVTVEDASEPRANHRRLRTRLHLLGATFEVTARYLSRRGAPNRGPAPQAERGGDHSPPLISCRHDPGQVLSGQCDVKAFDRPGAEGTAVQARAAGKFPVGRVERGVG